jgi:pimeloyl-ACP methyl ester carboxylesterase
MRISGLRAGSGLLTGALDAYSVTGMRLVTRAAAAAAAVGVASFAYQAIAEERDRHRFPPPGRLVDIGGRRLHLVTAGEGSPAVVIIPALADNVLQWLPIVDGCARETRVCVYDRAEVGWSDPPPHGRRTFDLIADDLHALLAAAGIPPPYVLVGHSIGGIAARRFYVRYPGIVAGIVLVESSHEDQGKRTGGVDWRYGPAMHIVMAARRQARILGVRRLAASLGLIRGLDAMVAREAPPEHAGADRAILLSARQRRASVGELLMAARMGGQPPRLGSIPLTVLTRARRPGAEPAVWAQLQDELAALSSDSAHLHAERGGHYLQFDEPDLVIKAIRDLVRRCR